MERMKLDYEINSRYFRQFDSFKKLYNLYFQNPKI